MSEEVYIQENTENQFKYNISRSQLRQGGMCMSQQMFISGQDQPDDQPEYRLGLS